MCHDGHRRGLRAWRQQRRRRRLQHKGLRRYRRRCRCGQRQRLHGRHGRRWKWARAMAQASAMEPRRLRASERWLVLATIYARHATWLHNWRKCGRWWGLRPWWHGPRHGCGYGQLGDHALGEGFGAGDSINVGNGLGIGEGCALGAGLGLSNSTNQGAGEGSSIGGGLCRMLGRSDCVGIGCRRARIGP